MAALGCPYPIKSTFFKPLGASYSWPYLLAVLDWLVDLVEVKRDAMLNDYDEKQENVCERKSRAWRDGTG
jgi:hypothetical protein